MGGPAPQMLSYILPNLTAAASSHLPRRRTAQGYQSTRRLRQVPKLEVRLCLARGFCPPFWGEVQHMASRKLGSVLQCFTGGFCPPFLGVQICTPLFFECWARGIAPGRAQRIPLLLSFIYCSRASQWDDIAH